MDIEQERRKILRQVADGTLDPSDAADRLAALDADADADASGDAPAGDRREEVGYEYEVRRERKNEPAADPSVRARRIKVGGAFRSVEVIGDRDVTEAVAEGPHRARRDGDVLVIDGSMLDEEDGFVFTRGHGRGVRFNVSRGSRPRPLIVRMNPDLDLDARVEAGPLTIEDVRGKIRARVAAGPLKVEGFRRPLDLRVAAGTVKARGRLEEGDSRIDCEAGKVQVHFESGSSVRVKASASLGKVGRGPHGLKTKSKVKVRHGSSEEVFDLGNLHAKLSGMFVDNEEIVIGEGRAQMEVNVAMGAADITSDDDQSGPLADWDDDFDDD